MNRQTKIIVCWVAGLELARYIEPNALTWRNAVIVFLTVASFAGFWLLVCRKEKP